MWALINISMRGASLGCKFLLVLVLAKLLPPQEVGIYGLVSAIVGLGVYIIGLEFYTFSIREIVIAEKTKKWEMILNQGVLYFFMYLLSIPILIWVFNKYRLPTNFLTLVLLILILEHISLELNRLLVALGQPIFASCVFFIRMGLWVIIFLIAQYWINGLRNLESIFYFWIIGLLMACVLACSRIFALSEGAVRVKVNIRWLASGLYAAIPLLLASIAIRAMSTIDRFMLEMSSGVELVAPYVVYAGMCAAVMSLIDAGVVDFLYPKLIRLQKENKKSEVLLSLKKSSFLMVGLALTSLIAINIVWYQLAPLFFSGIYSDNYWMLVGLSLATIFYVLSLPGHLYLYVIRDDFSIFCGNAIGFVVFVASFALFENAYEDGAQSVVFSIIAGWIAIFIWKSKMAFFKKNTREQTL